MNNNDLCTLVLQNKLLFFYLYILVSAAGSPAQKPTKLTFVFYPVNRVTAWIIWQAQLLCHSVCQSPNEVNTEKQWQHLSSSLDVVHVVSSELVYGTHCTPFHWAGVLDHSNSASQTFQALTKPNIALTASGRCPKLCSWCWPNGFAHLRGLEVTVPLSLSLSEPSPELCLLLPGVFLLLIGLCSMLTSETTQLQNVYAAYAYVVACAGLSTQA